ncbi:hypothetical protein BJF78_24130 [Pseudonocardia sp. CNS-139]|nr:hypothetical protein BJF78_24130 [Pseudonocardia sp. CNS-139]
MRVTPIEPWAPEPIGRTCTTRVCRVAVRSRIRRSCSAITAGPPTFDRSAGSPTMHQNVGPPTRVVLSRRTARSVILGFISSGSLGLAHSSIALM